MLYILTFFVQFSMINLGYDMGALSGAILLAENIKYLRLDQSWKELIAAGPMPSAALCCLIGSYLSDKFGRRKNLMISCSCYIIGAALSGLAYNREMLLFGRLLVGCGIGIASASTSVYVAECSPRQIRGCLIGLSQPFLTIGILSGIVISALFSSNRKNGWRYIWGIQGMFAFIQLIGLCFLPESPRWFIQKSWKDEANKSLIRIRSRSKVQEELQEIEKNFKEMQIDIQKKGSSHLFLNMLKTRSVRSALIVGCAIQLFSQFSGANTIIYYTGIIVHLSGVGNITNALWISVIINCFTLVFSIVGVWLSDRVGRRKLVIIGLLGLFFSNVYLATTFLVVAKFSPEVDVTANINNNPCSVYRQCYDCIADENCGFCYDDVPYVKNGSCLPIKVTSNLASKQGACNSSASLLKNSKKWANDYCPVSFSWIVIIGLAFFLMTFAPGMGPLPWTVNAEIYPHWARSTASGTAAMTSWLCSLIVAASFMTFARLIQIYGVFYIMSTVALVGALFCFFFLPETKNKTLEEIEALFSSNTILAR